jgi:nucleotidyltransferase substrate binding protein (TIGR01987 family)
MHRSIEQLQRSRDYADSKLAEADPGIFEQLRNSVIHCFEVTYEISHKMLKRYLKASTANPGEVDAMTFQDLIRSGSERQLLRSDWKRWKEYRQARTDISHAYDADKAASVYAIAPEFLQEAQHLYGQMTRRDGR